MNCHPKLENSEENILCRGNRVDIVWPSVEDYDWITNLRNKNSVRKWFLNSSCIAPDAGRAWISEHVGCLDDAIVVVQHRASHTKMGFLGWLCCDKKKLTFEAGRLAFDFDRIRDVVLNSADGDDTHDFALDACLAVRDYIFGQLNANKIITTLKAGNHTAMRINRKCGLIPLNNSKSKSDMVKLGIDRSLWKTLTNQLS